MPYKDPEVRRERQREYGKRYREKAGKAKLYAHTLKWRKKNWDKHLATAKRWREAHPEAAKEAQRKADQNPERKRKRNERNKAKRAADPEAYRAYMREYRL